MPAGFWRENMMCQQIRDFRQAQQTLPVDSITDNLSNTSLLENLPQTLIQDDEPTVSSSPTETQKSSSSYIPILRCVDKPSSSLPSQLMFTEDSIWASVGFQWIDTIKKHLKT
jgi:hypothetical protein